MSTTTTNPDGTKTSSISSSAIVAATVISVVAMAGIFVLEFFGRTKDLVTIVGVVSTVEMAIVGALLGQTAKLSGMLNRQNSDINTVKEQTNGNLTARFNAQNEVIKQLVSALQNGHDVSTVASQIVESKEGGAVVTHGGVVNTPTND